MAEPGKSFGHQIAEEALSDIPINDAAKTEIEKDALLARFMELLIQGSKTNPGVKWRVETWGGLRGEHPEYTGRLSPIGFVAWSITGNWPTIVNETDHLDSLGFESVSYALGEACENYDGEEAGKRTLRRRIVKRLRIK